MSMVSEGNSETRSRSAPRTLRNLATNNYIIGICLLLIVVILWTLSNFVTQVCSASLLHWKVTYTSTSAFTCYLIPFYLRRIRSRKNTSYQPLAQDIPHEPNSNGLQCSYNETLQLTSQETAWLALYFCFLWFAANWSLNAALAYTSVASATVLSSMSGIFTLGVGRLFRVEALTAVKFGAVLLRYGGRTLEEWSSSHSPDSSQDPGPYSMTRPFHLLPVIGDILALLSALLYAIYMIFLKVKIREESRIDMQLFFGFVGLFNIPPMLAHLELPTTRQALAAIMFITLSMTIGVSLTIPLAVTGDFFLGKPAAAQVVVGAFFVLIGFIVVGVENCQSGAVRPPH
ncbi:vacuolar membrane protein [Pisolithus croceorrhizus]|nr:vacuolar membrane protein [Pisolithus croceorrhizus]